MYQFIHIETYARKSSTKVKPTSKPSKKAPKAKLCVQDVVNEALRIEGHCSHVENVKPPIFLFGNEDDLRKLPSLIDSKITEFEKTNKKVRIDAAVLLAGITSFPREYQTSDPAIYAKWKSKTLDYLQEKYGKNLQVVLEHEDEAHPHLHFYVVADDPNAKKLHDGHCAQYGMNVMTKDAQVAFSNAMRVYQTEYFEKVARDCGLSKDGPKRRRTSRAEHIINKEHQKELARSLEDIENIQFQKTILNGLKKNFKLEEAALEALIKKSNDLLTLLKKPKIAELLTFLDSNTDAKKLVIAAMTEQDLFKALQNTLKAYEVSGIDLKTSSYDSTNFKI